MRAHEANDNITQAVLQDALVDLIAVSLTAKQAHWNVRGHRFWPLHQQLDELATTVTEHSDAVAERSRAIGGHPDGRVTTVAKSFEERFDSGDLPDHEVVAGVIALLSRVRDDFRDRIARTESTDPITQDLLISVSHDLEKQLWFFEAQQPV